MFVKILILLPEEYLHDRGEHRIPYQCGAYGTVAGGTGLTKTDDPEGFQRSVEESPEPGEREGMTIQECDRWHASLGSRLKGLVEIGRGAVLRGCHIRMKQAVSTPGWSSPHARLARGSLQRSFETPRGHPFLVRPVPSSNCTISHHIDTDAVLTAIVQVLFGK